MTELYINGQKADIDANTVIAFNYSSISTENPTAAKGAYSKTVSLPDTEANRRIFDGIQCLRQRSAVFHPNRRTPFTLNADGKSEQGYIQLNKVSKRGSGVTYECTLYSDIGNFFFNLAYGSDGKAKSFKDMYFGLTNPVDGKIFGRDAEDTKTILNWNWEYITQSWEKLYQYDPYAKGTDPMTVITGAPTYNGVPEDFDAKRILVQYSALSSELQQQIAPPEGYDIDTKAKGWVLTEASRELDPFEARNLPSSHISPAIRCRFLIDNIVKPENNGGYEVEIDREILDSPYYNDTWLVMSELDLTSKGKDVEYEFNPTPIQVDTPLFWTEQELVIGADTSTIKNPYASIDVSLAIQSKSRIENLYTTVCSVYGLNNLHRDVDYSYGGFAFRMRFEDGDTVTYSPVEFFTTPMGDGHQGHGFGHHVPDCVKRLSALCGCDEENFNVNEVEYKINGEQYATLDSPLRITAKIPNSQGLRVYLECKYVEVSLSGFFYGLRTMTAKRQYMPVNATVSVQMHIENATNGIYGTVPPSLQKTSVTKADLFQDVMTPYEFFIGWCRIQGLRFITDGKKVTVLPRGKYYTGEVQVLDGQISLDEIDIEPVLTTSKWFKYGLNAPDTYASELYRKKSDSPYGSLLVDTGYYFNNEEKDVFENVKFENTIPYRLNSIYFNDYDMPSTMYSPTYNVIWHDGNNEVKSGYALENTVYSVYDSYPKLCHFDRDNKSASIKNNLAFFSGYQTGTRFLISDHTQICDDIAGKQCYMYSTGDWYSGLGDDAPSHFGTNVDAIPTFTKYLRSVARNATESYTHSLDFAKPLYTFVSDATIYPESSTLYSRFWKQWIGDIYNPENRKVTLRALLRGNATDLLRRIFYFDGNYWVLESLNDYCYTAQIPQKATFIRINDTSAWTDSELVFFKDTVFEEDYTKPSQREYDWNMTVTAVTDTTSFCLGYVDNNDTLKSVQVDGVTYSKSMLTVFGGKYYATSHRGGRHVIRIAYEDGWIPQEALKGQMWVQNVTVHQKTNVIAYNAFRESGIETISIESGYIDIGRHSFRDCHRLTAVNISNRYNIQEGAFEYTTNPEFRFNADPEKCDSVGIWAFARSGIGRINWFNTAIPEACFFECPNLKVIEIPDGCPSIGKRAFESCTGLERITIPSGVLSIQERAFALTSSLREIKLLHVDTAPTLITNTVFDGVRTYGTVRYFAGCDIHDWDNMDAHYLGYYYWFFEPVDGTYKVTYHVGGDIYAVQRYLEGETIIPPANPDIQGMDFIGWQGLPETMPAHDIDVYAQTINYEDQYLTIEAIDGGSVWFYSKCALDWEIMTSRDTVNWSGVRYWNETNPIAILDAGEKLYIKGKVVGTCGRFDCRGRYRVSGNIMSMLYGDDFRGKTEINVSQAFKGMFANDLQLVDASNLYINGVGYESCATMFGGCANLVYPPVLGSDTTAVGCYSAMFRDCTSLATAPMLKASVLHTNCYYAMFMGCTSLTTAPEIKADTIEIYSMYRMFMGCTSLNRIKFIYGGSLSTTESYYWMNDVSPDGIFIKHPDGTLPSGVSGIPTGWTVETATE